MKTVAIIVCCIVEAKFNRCIKQKITAKTTNHTHIRDQQVKIYKNPYFVFDFTSIEFLTVFSTAILTGSW